MSTSGHALRNTVPLDTASPPGTAIPPPRRLAAVTATLGTLARHAWCIEDEVQGLGDVVGPGDVCVDIGAEYGLYSVALAGHVGVRGRVHSIEPQPGAGRLLEAAVRLAGAGRIVRSHRIALADAPRRDVMSVPRRTGLPVHGRAHLTANAVGPGPNATDFRSARWLPVEVTTLDALCATNGIERLRFVKADVEGAELHVLRGGMETIHRHRPLLQLEIQAPHMAKYGAAPEDIVALLAGLGYRMHSWRAGAWRPAPQVTEDHRNYLFVP